jgi:prolyl-tRNA synthetase
MSVVRYGQLFIPTLKEPPAEASAVSHNLLLRAGFIRQLGSGIYSYLPLAVRTLSKIEAIVREEMSAIGAQEFRLPALHPAEVWKESGRWDEVDETMFRLRDRRGGDHALGMTHEEVFTLLARGEVRSYRELPQTWYQIQTKFRDEPRPRGGLLRVREFTMKDSYSFDADWAGLDRAYEAHRLAYRRIFERCGLDAVDAQAFSGLMGGKESAEFVVRADAGEDFIAFCAGCRYAGNVEVATSRLQQEHDRPTGPGEPERFATPGVTTIDDLTRPPYGVAATRQLKSLVYVADGEALLAVLRGDHELNEAKLQAATGATAVRPAHPEEIVALMGAHAGSLGPVGFSAAPVLVDHALAERTDMVTGANQDGYHLRNVDVARDVLTSKARLADLRTVRSGEGCPACGAELEVFRSLEVGHIFKLGTRYSERMGASVLGADGKQTPIVMGSYGIGIGRIMAAAIEQHHDDGGIIWPRSIAPFDAIVLTLGGEPEITAAAEDAVRALSSAGLDVLFDDRNERPGVKFKDADLLGIPLRVAVGKRGLAEGRSVEWKFRRDSGAPRMVSIDGLTSAAEAWVRG